MSGVGPGLGREIALEFAREGADVALGARTESYLREVAAEVEALGRRAIAVPTDITDQDQCDRLVHATVDGLGGVDVVVHNAFASSKFRTFEDADLRDWRAVMDVNLFGSLQLTKSVLPAMKERGGGSIVFVNSMIVRKPLPTQGSYATSKGALDDRGADPGEGARRLRHPGQLDGAGLDDGSRGRRLLRAHGAHHRRDSAGDLRLGRGRDRARARSRPTTTARRSPSSWRQTSRRP